MKKVTIMRGIPGSGKSTWIENNCCSDPTYAVSADDYFTDIETGEYRFDSTKLPLAHNVCLQRFLALLNSGVTSIVVDNTNVRTFEIAPYYRLAEIFGYEVEVIWLVCDPSVAVARSIHGVPENLVRSMAVSFDPLPAWWNVRIVSVS